MLADPAGSKKALNELIAARDEAVAATKAFGDVKAKADELDQRAATLTGSETSLAERPRSCRRAVTGLAVHSRFRSALQMLRLFSVQAWPVLHDQRFQRALLIASNRAKQHAR